MNNKTYIASKIMVFTMIAAGLFSAHAEEPGAEEYIVEIVGFKFVPEQLEVKPGDTVAWINRDIAPHTATGKDGTWDTGTLKQNESKSIVVSQEMSGKYFCRFHINMVASISVADDRKIEEQ